MQLDTSKTYCQQYQNCFCEEVPQECQCDPSLDPDCDGVKGSDDLCPQTSEYLDGVRGDDPDGCPDYDNDEDGIPDSLELSECMNTPCNSALALCDDPSHPRYGCADTIADTVEPIDTTTDTTDLDGVITVKTHYVAQLEQLGGNKDAHFLAFEGTNSSFPVIYKTVKFTHTIDNELAAERVRWSAYFQPDLGGMEDVSDLFTDNMSEREGDTVTLVLSVPPEDRRAAVLGYKIVARLDRDASVTTPAGI